MSTPSSSSASPSPLKLYRECWYNEGVTLEAVEKERELMVQRKRALGSKDTKSDHLELSTKIAILNTAQDLIDKRALILTKPRRKKRVEEVKEVKEVVEVIEIVEPVQTDGDTGSAGSLEEIKEMQQSVLANCIAYRVSTESHKLDEATGGRLEYVLKRLNSDTPFEPPAGVNYFCPSSRLGFTHGSIFDGWLKLPRCWKDVSSPLDSVGKKLSADHVSEVPGGLRQMFHDWRTGFFKAQNSSNKAVEWYCMELLSYCLRVGGEACPCEHFCSDSKVLWSWPCGCVDPVSTTCEVSFVLIPGCDVKFAVRKVSIPKKKNPKQRRHGRRTGFTDKKGKRK